MQLFVTDRYFANTQKQIDELTARLAEIRAGKNAAYSEDTNTWHDNFAYEHLTREEKQTQKQLFNLQADLASMTIVTDRPVSMDTVGLYCWVDVHQENLETGAESDVRIGIVPLGGENIADRIYAYNAPIVYPLMGLPVGADATIQLPSGKIQVSIMAIHPFA